MRRTMIGSARGLLPLSLLLASLTLGCNPPGSDVGDEQISESLADGQAGASKGNWAANKDYKPDNRVIYQGVEYQSLAFHRSKKGWEPTKAPGLWHRYPVYEWHDDRYYAAGDRVTWAGVPFEATVSHLSSGWNAPGRSAEWKLVDVGLSAQKLGEINAFADLANSVPILVTRVMRDGQTLSIYFEDQGLGMSFKLDVSRPNSSKWSQKRFVQTNGSWRQYFARSTDTSARTDQFSYDSAAMALMQMPNDANGRNRMDAAAAAALGSSGGMTGLRDLNGKVSEEILTCQRGCSAASNEINLAAGLASTALCAPFLGPFAIGCGVIGTLTSYKFGPSQDLCFDNCTECHEKMKSGCMGAPDGSAPYECWDSPWRCKGGKPAKTERITLF